ncbi:MAG: hypothetical protein ACRD2G_16615 [Terriglobia bacterium]
MTGSKNNRTRLCLAALLTALFCPAFARSQEVARQALSAFPPDTQQVAYVNLAELRSLPNYRQLRGILFNRQMIYFEQFLRSIGADPEKDVDEAVVGWRGAPTKSSPLFGLAAGRFNVVEAQNSIAQESLPAAQYQGFTLDAFGAGHSSQDLFFTFFNEGLAGFGRLTDLKALIDGYLGRRPTLNSNPDFVKWEGNLDGSAPEWGITTGKAALNVAVPWLAGVPGLSGPSGLSDRAGQKGGLESVIGPVKAVLYQANWGANFSAEISIICENAQSAQTLAELLSVWRDSSALTGKRPADVNNFIQGLEINASGNEVTLDGQGPPAAVAQLLQNALAH